MKPSAFQYHRPATIDDALQLLQTHDDARLLAGGQSLIPAMNFRLAAPEALIDLGHIAELRDITVDAEGNLQLGAMVRHVDCQRDNRIQQGWPLIQAALQWVAHTQVRHRGTIGGSLAHADPAAEWPAICLALKAVMTVRDANGDRHIAAADFFQGVYATALTSHDILTRITFPAWPTHRRWGFHEISRRRGDFAIAGAIAVLDADAEQRCRSASVVLFGVADAPVALGALTPRLVGHKLPALLSSSSAEPAPDPDFVERCDDLAFFARRAVEPRADLHADESYRQQLIEVVVSRALRQAATGELASEPELAELPLLHPATGALAAPPPRQAPTGLKLTVPADLPPRLTLADYLRDHLRLTGTHLGCEHGVCGACTVLLDGESVRSCLVFAVQAEGHEVTTIENLTPAQGLSDLQQQFVQHHALQCGFCTPGMIVSAEALLRETPDPSAEQVREALSGNICRCTGYVPIIEAVLATARQRQGVSS